MQVNIFFFATPTTWVALQWEGTYSNNIERIQWGCSMDPHHHHHKEKKHVPASKRTTGPGVLYWKSLCMWDSLKSCADQTAETFSVEESARWRAAPTRHHALQAPTDRLPIATHCTLHPSLALCSLLWVSRFPFLLHPITLIDRLCCFRSDHKKTLQTLAKLRTRNCALAIAVNRYWVVEFLCNKPLSSQAVIWDVSRPNQSELFGYFYAFLRDLLYYQWYFPIFGFYGLHNWHLTHRKTFLFKFTDSNNIQVHHWKIFQLSNVDRVYFQFRKTTVTHKWNWTKFLMLFFFTPRLTGREPLVFLPGPFPNEPPTGKAHLKQCEQMSLTRRQKRLCRREPGLAETLRESVRLSLLECRYQFRNERWNCSLDGRGSLLKRGEPFL